jgi:hypothetical protein
LLSVSVVLAVAMLVLFQARFIVRLAMQLHWRWKVSMSELRDEVAEGESRSATGKEERSADPHPNGPPTGAR